MLLFEHKQHLQSYDVQSSAQREILGLIYETNVRPKIGIYQYRRERWLQSNLMSGLSSCTQVFEFEFACSIENLRIIIAFYSFRLFS